MWTCPASSCQPGGFSRRSPMSCSIGSNRESHGAPSAVTTTTTITASPKSAVRRRARRRANAFHSAGAEVLSARATVLMRPRSVEERAWRGPREEPTGAYVLVREDRRRTRTKPGEAHRRCASSQTDAWVEVRVHEVDRQVDDDERR